ncbi:MAG: hypothetical protein A3G34_08615 [Candidatus Lindowbacteria bacterium RIFCSPLOWO2_12_FULL_62_27]|nr:MAG: hypothetical protein A3G34_08615 [Candidatus Lindowbacteria bacterium RIFCSPLOWO2_12_FULL_62_27]OGH62956.1 MAG: hypothetical protein A3I06_13865 [Candidatus Lindowbacteria bacterium RIFCSPLOWO2_02_FULL_62_12]
MNSNKNKAHRSNLTRNLKEALKYIKGDPTAKVIIEGPGDFRMPEPMIAQDVRRVRTKLGFTQSQLASALGESVRTVQGWESNDPRRRPNGAARRLMEMLWRNPKPVLALLNAA